MRYRVDRMKEIEIRRIDRKGQALFEELAKRGGDLAKQFFSVEEGKSQTVELVCQNHLLNAVIERFGEDTKVDVYKRQIPNWSNSFSISSKSSLIS